MAILIDKKTGVKYISRKKLHQVAPFLERDIRYQRRARKVQAGRLRHALSERRKERRGLRASLARMVGVRIASRLIPEFRKSWFSRLLAWFKGVFRGAV